MPPIRSLMRWRLFLRERCEFVDARQLEKLRSMVRGDIAVGRPLRNETSFRVGGPAGALVEPADLDDLRRVVDLARTAGVAVGFLGGGSNVLALDTGFDGLLVRLGRGFAGLWRSGTTVAVGAAVPLAQVVTGACRWGLGGLEGFIGIPGTVGGALAMNAGAQDLSIGDLVETVTVLDGDGAVRDVGPEDLLFGYRTSRLQRDGWLALEARLRLEERDPAEVERSMTRILGWRQKTQPVGVPSAGSVFKNPPGQAAGFLLERAGVKGMMYGGAEISGIHANFIVNRGGATAADILWLIRRARYLVWRRDGVVLEPEIKLVGARWDQILPQLS